MPYVPSEKTNPPAEDRKILNPLIRAVAEEAATQIDSNFSLIRVYKSVFIHVAGYLRNLLEDGRLSFAPDAKIKLAQAIYELCKKWGYEGAFLGELNYSVSRFIQVVPQIKVTGGEWEDKDELRYWLYDATAEALVWASVETRDWGIGICGAFMDIKDEYKVRVNQPYEIAQILKSGDCYDTPYYSRVVEVVDAKGKLVGHLYVALKRSPETLSVDLLSYQFVLRKRPSARKKSRAKKPR